MIWWGDAVLWLGDDRARCLRGGDPWDLRTLGGAHIVYMRGQSGQSGQRGPRGGFMQKSEIHCVLG